MDSPHPSNRSRALRRVCAPLLAAAIWLAAPPEAGAFCGFYVGKADAKLFNRASQVVVARNEDKTVISMMNDYEGELAEFALVVPVPEVLQKGQIHVGDRELFRRIDAYSAPRLVEYHDPDPCRLVLHEKHAMDGAAAPSAARNELDRRRAKSLGVTIEASYTVGEYDVAILSAKQSDGLETWLRENGYRIPEGARRALAPYVRQKLKFFVARVNLEEQRKTGLRFLRPLQFAVRSPKFMLPIRLGMLNAEAGAEQDLVVFLLTRSGRVETTNYRTVMLPTGMDLPVFVRDEFTDFYKAMFAEQHRKARAAVFTEYVWNMGWCDPCAEDPLSPDELRKLGVFWLDAPAGDSTVGRPWPGGAVPVIVTRLHVRTTAEHFPEDLVFQETGDAQNFQARYVLRHAWAGSQQCEAAERYRRGLPERHEREATTLASLTGWELATIRGKMKLDDRPAAADTWWKTLWD